MSIDELTQFLKQNLRVVAYREDDWGTNYISIELMLGEDTLSKETIRLPDDPAPERD